MKDGAPPLSDEPRGDTFAGLFETEAAPVVTPTAIERAPDPVQLAQIEEHWDDEEVNLGAGSKHILDMLDDLSPTHPARLGLRVKLMWTGPDGVQRLMPGAWEDDLPTEQRVAGKVALGDFKPGAYKVSLRKGQRQQPYINFVIGDPRDAQGPAAGGVSSVGQVRELMALVRETSGAGAPMAPETAHDLATEFEGLVGDNDALNDRLDALEVVVGQLQTTVGQLSTMAQQFIGSAGADGDTDSEDGPMVKIAEKIFDRLMQGEPDTEAVVP